VDHRDANALNFDCPTPFILDYFYATASAIVLRLARAGRYKVRDTDTIFNQRHSGHVIGSTYDRETILEKEHLVNYHCSKCDRSRANAKPLEVR